MFTRRGIDLPSGPDPFMAPTDSIDGRFAQLEAAVAHERRERRRILEAISAWADWLNQEGALDLSDVAFPTESTTPTPTASVGAFTTVSSTVNVTSVGDRRLLSVVVTITTNNTAAGNIQVALPFTSAEVNAVAGVNASSGLAMAAYVSGATLYITKYDGTYPGADGVTIQVSGVARV